jgi:hypothetical protein
MGTFIGRYYPISILVEGLLFVFAMRWAERVGFVHPVDRKLDIPIIVKRVRKAYSGWRRLLVTIVPWLEQDWCTNTVASTSNHNGEVPLTDFISRQDVSNTSTPHQFRINDSGSGSLEGGRQGSHDGDDGNEDDVDSDEGESGNESEHESDEEGHNDDEEEHYLEAAELYLHVILSDSLSGKRQFAVTVTEIMTGHELFTTLNHVYRQHRGAWRAMFMVRGLRPTEFEPFNRTNVRTFFDPKALASTMPDLHNPPVEYVFSYHPVPSMHAAPLLHEAQLTKLYHSPSSSVYFDDAGRHIHDQQCYDRSPKRKGAMIYTPNNGFPTGYGFEFKECFDIKFILICESFVVLLAFVLAALYWALAREEQRTGTAFNIAMFVFVFGQFLYGVILALGERFEA